MPSQSRPDVLPFARPRRIGLPYHGLVKNSLLTLPSSATMAYRQPESGECWYVSHSLAAAASVTEGDQQWVNYALLSGTGREIGGQALGNEYSLYCDDAHTWRIRTVLTAGNGQFTVAAYLVGLFGVVHDGPVSRYAMSERKLAEATFSVVNYNGGAITWEVGQGSTRSYSPRGDKILLNVGSNNINAFSTFDQTGIGGSLFQHDVAVVNISGNGSTTQGSVGAGISATITHPYAATDLQIASMTQYKWGFAYQPSGALTNVDYWYNQVIPGVPTPGDVYQKKEATVSFGSSSVYAVTEYVGYFDVVSTGTVTINGTPFPVFSSGWFVCTLGLAMVPKNVNLWGLYRDHLNTIMAGCAHGGYTISESEDYGHYWSYNPATGQYASDPSQVVCFV